MPMTLNELTRARVRLHNIRRSGAVGFKEAKSVPVPA